MRQGNEGAGTETAPVIRLNRICTLFGIRCPVLQGGMLWIAGAELAAAVSNAGALGIISPYAGMDEGDDPRENLRLQIRRARSLTCRPFGVNIPLDLPMSGLLIDVVLQEKVNIAVTAAGSPELFTELLHSAGIRVVHVIGSVRLAQRAEACGVDAVIASGIEAGGRLGRDAIALCSLIPQMVNAVKIPVIAAGGIADATGMAAALKLGCDGVQLGTRFAASVESLAHSRYKRAIVDAHDEDTVVTQQYGVPARILRSSLDAGAGSRLAQLEGDVVNGIAYAGSSAGLIGEVLPAAAIVENLAESFASRL